MERVSAYASDDGKAFLTADEALMHNLKQNFYEYPKREHSLFFKPESVFDWLVDNRDYVMTQLEQIGEDH